VPFEPQHPPRISRKAAQSCVNFRLGLIHVLCRTVEADFRNLLTCYFSAPESVQNTFAFLHGEAQLRSEAGVARITSSWRFYDPVQEYARSGLYPSSDWRLADINKRYELSETYPRVFAVPQFVTDEELRVVAKFRSRARIPVAVWRHPQNNCVLIRCSQPLTGISSLRFSLALLLVSCSK
jgi:hypothetical protein